MQATARLQIIKGNIWGSPRLTLQSTAMIRTLLFLLVAGLVARASDPIMAPVGGTSVPVSQPHVVAELIPEMTTVEPGKAFDIALHLHSDPGWHTYWINPGDAGLATTLDWTLPPGFTAGPIQWPTPEKHNMGPLITYGYAGDVYLVTTITPPKGDLPQHFDIKAKATWLVCQEECIPGKADLALSFDSGLMNLRLPINNTDFFAQARERLPVTNTRWDVDGLYAPMGGLQHEPSGEFNPLGLYILFKETAPGPAFNPTHIQFFPEQTNVLGTQTGDLCVPGSVESGFELFAKLQQNGEKPPQISGVIVSDVPLIGKAKSIHITAFPTNSTKVPVVIDALTAPQQGSHGPPLQEGTAAQRAAATEGTAPAQGPAPATLLTLAALLAVLGGAFIGGLILNLMPCVLPVLSLKVFSLMKHAGENPKAAWVQGVAFTAGVVLSFWVLAGLLLALRSAGNHLGWGFQMQSPGFVLALILLFFLLALNLFGVFELGSSLVGLDAKATGHLGGLASSFGNGALATLAATPCTAPFMGSALGFAAQQPAYIALLVFTFLALGMATPYLLLTIFPGALRLVPKPGAWMEAFKQFMGFLLMATVIFLVYVFGALTGESQMPVLLGLLLFVGLIAWVYGRCGTIRAVICALAIAAIYCLAQSGLFGGHFEPVGAITFPLSFQYNNTKSTDKDWQPWTQDAVNAALDKGQPVFVDFTAAWCLSCKVNEQLALGTDTVKKAFAQKNVALFRADWTHSDPAISKTLQQFNRDGVPLYLLYSPKNKDAPQVLPEVLTPGIVLDALNKL